jgi:hypothetical protein
MRLDSVAIARLIPAGFKRPAGGGRQTEPEFRALKSRKPADRPFEP